MRVNANVNVDVRERARVRANARANDASKRRRAWATCDGAPVPGHVDESRLKNAKGRATGRVFRRADANGEAATCAPHTGKCGVFK